MLLLQKVHRDCFNWQPRFERELGLKNLGGDSGPSILESELPEHAPMKPWDAVRAEPVIID